MPSVVKKSAMTLFSDPQDVYSHQVRLVLSEKGVNFDVIYIEKGETNEDLMQLNPAHRLPTLVDRDLVIMHANIIMEYLDERFPHPPLLPVHPVARAKSRLLIRQIDEDWYPLLIRLQDNNKDSAAIHSIVVQLKQVAAIFSEYPFFMSNEFTMIDCCVAPLLWRLKGYGVVLPSGCESILAYQDRVFDRNSFQGSLSESEFDMMEDF
jgi:RNA polymerase-associated protein